MRELRVIVAFENTYNGISLTEFCKVEEQFYQEYSKVKSNDIRKRWRKLINTFPIAEYKKEKIWMYLNNDITKNEFDYFVSTTLEKIHEKD